MLSIDAFGFSPIPPTQSLDAHFDPNFGQVNNPNSVQSQIYPNPGQDFNDCFEYIPDPNNHHSSHEDINPSQPLINTKNLNGDNSDNNDKGNRGNSSDDDNDMKSNMDDSDMKSNMDDSDKNLGMLFYSLSISIWILNLLMHIL